MTEADKDKLAAEWIEYMLIPLDKRKREFRKNYESNDCSPFERLWDACRDEPELAWEIILRINRAEHNDNVIAVLAAGPLEDLLAEHGARFIERIETEARKDAKFNDLLGGVWRNSMTADVWARVKAARREIW